MGPAEPATGVDDPLRVELVYAAAPHDLRLRPLLLPPGATAADALRASGWLDDAGAGLAEGLRLGRLTLGVWGRACEPGTLLRDLDRVELYRPLLVDPKEARRQRYRRDGVKKKAPRIR